VNEPPVFTLREGASRLIVSIPHAGTYLPEPVAARLSEVGRAVVDTDWHVDRLYGFLDTLDVTVLVATHSRIVADLNRPPGGGTLYPGQAETGVCPRESFAGEALYAVDPPDAMELSQRLELYWRPYHAALQAQIERVMALHGEARLLDAHSIRAVIPRLFEGRLPDLNFGTYDGAACEGYLAWRVCAAAGNDFSQVLNGRFKGGYITRHYGAPVDRVNAVQLELSQCAYMDEAAPARFDAQRAAPIVAVLRRVVGALID
jgi:N-formylglutamate deformylase